MVGHTWEQLSHVASWKNGGEVGKAGRESDKGVLICGGGGSGLHLISGELLKVF